jgi:predicted nuclease of restriction endonuclease-like RecB superfamily
VNTSLALAKRLPALLRVTRWRLTATLVPRQGSLPTPQGVRFTLEVGCGLVPYYPPGQPHDSILEQAFAERWAQTPTAWRPEREVDLIPMPVSVMVPDFRLVHPDGRSCLLELVGYTAAREAYWQNVNVLSWLVSWPTTPGFGGFVLTTAPVEAYAP